MSVLMSRTGSDLEGVALEHVHARRVHVELARTGERARLVVADDGVGIPDGAARRSLGQGHIGFASHAVRIEAAGGTLTIEPGRPSGTTVSVEAPAAPADGTALRRTGPAGSTAATLRRTVGTAPYGGRAHPPWTAPAPGGPDARPSLDPGHDVHATATFYLRVFAPLGIREAMRFEYDGSPVVGLSGPDGRPVFWLGPATGAASREVHIAFAAPLRAAVDDVHRAALAAGAEILHAPRLWPEYHPGYYGVFLRDLDGNNVEAVHHQAP